MISPLDVRVLRVIRRLAGGARAVDISDRLSEPMIDVRASIRRLKRLRKINGKGRTRGKWWRAL
jgi:hypothetical protein